VCEICEHLFLNSKSERKIGKGQNCFTHSLQLLQQESNIENSKHHSEVLLMHSITELNSSPSSFQYLFVERMWKVEQEKSPWQVIQSWRLYKVKFEEHMSWLSSAFVTCGKDVPTLNLSLAK